eukprot:2052933-Rhodomonas_salina.2
MLCNVAHSTTTSNLQTLRVWGSSPRYLSTRAQGLEPFSHRVRLKLWHCRTEMTLCQGASCRCPPPLTSIPANRRRVGGTAPRAKGSHIYQRT